MTIAIGGKKWFATVDINYTKTDLDGVDNGIWTRNVAPRIGRRGEKSAFWIGDFISMSTNDFHRQKRWWTPVVLEVDFDVVIDWNFIYGGRWEPAKNLEFIVEHGFGGRNQVLVAFSVRF